MFGGFATNVKTTGYELTGDLGKCLRMGGLTFYKDFTKSGDLDADFALGSRKATYTCSRSATNPATYVDANGVIQLITTSNIPRFQGGYYDTTGFHAGNSGVRIEAAGTNLIPKSKVFNDATWTATTMTVTDNDVLSPDGTTNAGTLTASAGNGNILLTTAVTARTFSVWLKRKTGTGTINITANGGTTWAAVTLTSGWCRFQVTAASASQTCGVQIVTDTDAVYIWGAQFEIFPYATSFIPTTTAALTRNEEVLKYAIANNRTAAQETIVIKFTPSSDFANDGRNRVLLDTHTSRRLIQKSQTGTVLNANIAGGNLANSTTTLLQNISYVVGVIFSKTGDPNKNIFINGTSEGTHTADLTDTFGTSFWLGCDDSGVTQINGSIAWVKIFNRALTAAEVALVV